MTGGDIYQTILAIGQILTIQIPDYSGIQIPSVQYLKAFIFVAGLQYAYLNGDGKVKSDEMTSHELSLQTAQGNLSSE